MESVCLNGEVNRLGGGLWLECEQILVIVSIDDIIPGVTVALVVAVVADLKIDEAVADIIVIIEGLEGYDEDTCV